MGRKKNKQRGGRAGRGGQRSSNTGSSSSNNSNNNSNNSNTTARTKLSDYIFNVGSAKQASDFVTVSDYLIRHIKLEFTKGGDIGQALELRKEFDFDAVKPKLKRSTKADEDERKLENEEFKLDYNIDYKNHGARVNQYQENRGKAYEFLWKQCSKAMKDKIESRIAYESTIKNDPIKLLTAIREHAMAYQESKYQFETVWEALAAFVTIRQGKDEDLLDYLRRFKQAVELFKSHAGLELIIPKLADLMLTQNVTGTVVQQPEQYAVSMKSPADPKKKTPGHDIDGKYSKYAFERLVAYKYLISLDRSKYGSMVNEKAEKYPTGLDWYPESLEVIHAEAKAHKWDPAYHERKAKERENRQQQQQRSEQETTPQLTFAQIKDKCKCCGKTGHNDAQCYSRAKPKHMWFCNKNEEAKQFYQAAADAAPSTVVAPTSTVNEPQAQAQSSSASVAADSQVSWQGMQYQMSQKDDRALHGAYVLDSASSVDLFGDPKLVTQIKTATKPLSLLTNGGETTVHQEATVKDFGTVWYKPDAIANIFALGNMVGKHRVTFDSAKEDAFVVHTPRKQVKFIKDQKSNLYVHRPPMATMVQTMKENLQFHTPTEIAKAKRARKLLEVCGATPRDLKSIIMSNQIRNNPIAHKDVTLAESIFGKDIGNLKGHTTRRDPLPILTDQIKLPRELYKKQRNVVLCVDGMTVNGMLFFTTISKNIMYRTALPLDSNKVVDLRTSIDQVFRLYNGAGFRIREIHCDRQFQPLFDEIKDDLSIEMVYPAATAHVPQAERNNRTIKERVRSVFHRLPYAALPKIVMKHLVMDATTKLNWFPNKHGISPYFSPRMLLSREVLDYKRHCLIPFGSYVQAHDNPSPSELNTNVQRTIDCLYLRPVRNGHELYNISTQCVITRPHVTELPIPPTVIKAVEAIAASQKQKGLRIKARNGQVLYDSSWIAGVDFLEDDESNDESEESDEESDDEESDDEDTTDESEDEESEDEREEDDPNAIAEALDSGPIQVEPEPNINANANNADAVVPEVPQAPETRRSARAPAPQEQMNIADTSGQSYSQMYNMLQQTAASVDTSEEIEYDMDLARYAVNFLTAIKEGHLRKNIKKKGTSLLTQYSFKKGIQKFKQAGVDSAIKEMRQLHDRDCWNPIDPTTLKPTERKKAMESLIFLIQKKVTNEIKSRHCANGSIQRQWLDEKQASSPTVMTESVMITATIEAKEKRDVATVDIPNAFIQTEVEETDDDGDRVIMKICGDMVDLLIAIDPELYGPMVTYEHGKKTLYVHIRRAIYGMLQSALLFYKKFRKSLEEYKFKVNPYDPCVANKLVNGRTMTISWHVDDVKISHKDPKVVTEFVDWVKKVYGKEREVKVSRGKRHFYLGMWLDYSEEGKVKIDMKDYIRDMVKEFPEELSGKPASMATATLFDVQPSKKLAREQAQIFHTFVAKMLFLMKRGRPDAGTAISYLCTRVQEPTKDDWDKLVRAIKFLNATIDDVLTLEADDNVTLRWNIDAAFAVHNDLRSHTGATFTLGKGAIISISMKQKMNTRSSSEAELVGIDDVIAYVLWTLRFIQHQGYPVKTVIVEQDNQSTMKLANNGRLSTGKRTRHLDIRYFYVTDQIEKGYIKLQYIPTKKMTSDYMSKPLQGQLMRTHRADILNIASEE